MMAAVETVELNVRCKKGNIVSALIKMFESNHDDLAPKRRQTRNIVIVSDVGRYAPGDVTGTWMPNQSRGDRSRGQNEEENMKKIKPRTGFVKKMVTRFGRLSLAEATSDDR